MKENRAVTVPVWVERTNGIFTASIPGIPQLLANGPTKDAALAALRTALDQRMTQGEFVLMQVPNLAVTDRAGTRKDDPYIEEIVAEAYRHRDEQKRQEFGE